MNWWRPSLSLPTVLQPSVKICSVWDRSLSFKNVCRNPHNRFPWSHFWDNWPSYFGREPMGMFSNLIYYSIYEMLWIGKHPIQSVPITHLSFARRQECSIQVSAYTDSTNTIRVYLYLTLTAVGTFCRTKRILETVLKNVIFTWLT